MGIPERKERERQQRKDEIIRAAESVFLTQGFEQSTMDEIAEKAELSKGTLYLYFKSKEDLHMAVARKAIILLNSFAEEVAKAEGTALDKLLWMGRACIEFSQTYPDHMKAIMSLEGIEMPSPGVSAKEVQDLIYEDSPVSLVIQIVELGVAEQLIRSDIPPPLIAHTLWMQMLSVIRFISMKTTLFEVLEITPDKVYESHFELVLNGICHEKSIS